MMSFGPNHAPIRCFFRDIEDRFLGFKAGDRDVKFRLLGTVVEIADQTIDDAEDEALSFAPRRFVKLDDGTALAKVIITNKMMATIGLQIGTLVECIATMTRMRETKNPEVYTVPQYSLVAEQVAALNDPNAETLRWLELCHDKGKNPQGGEWRGFPMIPITAMDLFRIIEYQCNFETMDSSIKNIQPKGVSAETLKTCFQLTDSQVENFLSELQNEGLIYQNKMGNFCKL